MSINQESLMLEDGEATIACMLLLVVILDGGLESCVGWESGPWK